MRSRPVRWAPCIIARPRWRSPFAVAAEAQTPKRGGTLRVSYGNEIANLDFHTAPGYEMMWVAMNVGCGLVEHHARRQVRGRRRRVVADVARRPALHLQAPTRTSSSTTAPRWTPPAVKFSIDRLMDPNTKSGMRTFYESVHSVEVVDPLTVQIRLKQPYAFFLHMLAAYRTGLVLYSPTATQKYTLEDRKQGKPERGRRAAGPSSWSSG